MKNILFVLFLALIHIACGDSAPQAEPTPSAEPAAAQQTLSLSAEQMRSAGIEVGQPESRSLSSTLSANGTVAVLPEGRASVSSKLAGRIEQFFIHEGQNVRKGQALLSISSSMLFDIQQAYLQARADLVFLEKEVERQKTLSGEQVGATKHWEEAQSKLLRAQADMQAAAAKLRYLGIGLEGLANAAQPNFARTVVVTSPLDGNITDISVNLGSSVTEGTVLCNIVNLNDLHAHIEVFAKDIASVRTKQAATVRFPNSALPDLRTEVEFISQDMSPDTKTYSLHIHLPTGKGH
ncbi:MAG TPA: efflux RND transporter periplasmic adaptor subunit, partial [Saprospiraceae bacterium]|nr:efflux RND transporter periplasmic adaptor subunit [Saprospiraceae bacterium]